ncbi:alpha/beta fold hydrolase [Legionella dresdenensis]|uniref:Alpha/beta fold hydrolase n=1 Tax=Legionella dresdenensis TaxID=450200 RepID=A0ABV8CCT4_9GAMM
MKPNIHFAHGNGFPSPCYRQLFLALEERYQVGYIDRVGHNPRYPVTENWHHLVDELIDSIRQKYNEPVIGLGHSLGGALNYLAALKQPELFQAVVMIDSPLLNRFKSRIVRLAKKLGFIDRITPAYRTRGRRQTWATYEQLEAYLRDRPLFKTFSDACLKDYIEYGCKKDENGYSLRFERSIEYMIYRTVPHHLPKYEGKLDLPAALIYGDHSDVVDGFDVRYMTKKYQIKCFKMPGTHLLPMEDPQGTAQQIFTALDAIL